MISQKCQYALRAIFELARRHGEGRVKVADIARAQAVPHRFLEVILGQLKQGGFVASQRGNAGGYYLLRSPRDLTVGDMVRFVEGPIGPVGCVNNGSKDDCPLYGNCVFLPMWLKVQHAMLNVYDNTTFHNLVEQEIQRAKQYVPRYAI